MSLTTHACRALRGIVRLSCARPHLTVGLAGLLALVSVVYADEGMAATLVASLVVLAVLLRLIHPAQAAPAQPDTHREIRARAVGEG